MERNLIMALLVLLFAIGANVAPAAGGSSFTDGWPLELGFAYSLSYNTSTLLRQLQRSGSHRVVSDVGFQLLATAQCSVLWQRPRQQLLQLQLDVPQLHVRSRHAPQMDGFMAHTSHLDSASPSTLLALLSAEQEVRLWRPADDSGVLLSLARGLAGLLHARDEGRYREVDVSGPCDVTYVADSVSLFVKNKTNCEADRAQFSGAGVVLGTVDASTRITRYKHDNGRLKEVDSDETHRIGPRVSPDHGVLVSSHQRLQVTDSARSAPSLQATSADQAVAEAGRMLGWTSQVDAASAPPADDSCVGDHCLKLSELVAQLRAALAEAAVGSATAARAHVRLVSRLRSASQQQVANVLRDGRNRDVLPALLDAAGAAQTAVAHAAAKRAVNWQSSELGQREERYLVSLSTATHPPVEVVEDMVKEAFRQHASQELHESIQLCAAALAATHCARQPAAICDDYSRHLVSQLTACSDDEQCCVPSLRALTNLRWSASVPALVAQVNEAEAPACRQEALRALAAFPASVVAPLRPLLQRVFSDTEQYSSSSRLLAAELLLTAPTADDVALLLRDLPDRGAAELSAYLLQRLRAAARGDARLSEALQRHLADGRVNNYAMLALGARSAVLQRRVAGSTDGALWAGFDSALEMGAAGQLKRSRLLAQLSAGNETLDMLSFSVAAAGLSALVGAPDPEDAADASARLELTLLGRRLRPRHLFASQGELMALLWSGAGSERTSALRGTVPLHDHARRLTLQNGLAVQLSQLAAVTFDFAGQVEVSLWNRNAQALVETTAAVVVRTEASLSTHWVQMLVRRTAAVDARLTALTDAEFSDGPRNCLRISQHSVAFREAVRKQEHVPGSHYRLRRVHRSRRHLPPATFALNQLNSDHCRAMYGPGRR